MIGIGEEGLPALLAAVADSRIQRLGIAGYVHSYVSLMQTMSIQNKNDLVARWNSAERRGLINAANYDVDLGSVIPGMAAITDVPDLISLIAPRRVLFCQARDNESQMTKRFQHVAGKIRYEPRTKLDAALLLNWLQDVAN
jgi:hypothetical protein